MKHENIYIFINKSINYLWFIVYSPDELIIKAATTMAAARTSSPTLSNEAPQYLECHVQGFQKNALTILFF